ncbi:MAG: hypothetical protein JW940_07490 [Polyangiaceae bacterium]|nr:hypothetical protein [Polyangiaceae bacterium]
MKRNKYGGAILALAGVLGTAGLAAAQTPTQPSGSGSMDLGVSAGASSTGDSQAAATATSEAPPGYAPGVAPTQPPAAAQRPPPPPATLPPPGTLPPPVPPPPPAAPELPDHEKVAGQSGVGLLGVTTVDHVLADGESTSGSSLPLIGLRHWAASKGWGWQLGVGASHHSGTSSDSTPGRDNVDDPTVWNMGLHFGLPLAVYWDDHYTFLVLPNVNGGYSTWRQLDNDNTPGDQGVSGNTWAVSGGVRVGAEVHFGFIGVPMLTLQGTVGADLVWQRTRVEAVEAGREVTHGRWGLDLRTADFNDPWALFTNSISALYYFQ